LEEVVQKECGGREARALDGHAQRARQSLEGRNLGGRRAAAAGGCEGRSAVQRYV
jgi:hypothetical protein